MPGTKNISAARGLPARLRRLSTRLLPCRSGSASRCSSSTRTKPGSPPRGETSGQPSGEAVASVANGRQPDEGGAVLVEVVDDLVAHPLGRVAVVREHLLGGRGLGDGGVIHAADRSRRPG